MARALGGVISLCPVTTWMVDSRGVLGPDGHIRCGDTGWPTAPLSTGWLVVVSGDTGSGHRVDSSGRPGEGGSLHLYSAYWFVHRCGVGCSRPDGPLAVSKDRSSSRCGPGQFGVRDRCKGSTSLLAR